MCVYVHIYNNVCIYKYIYKYIYIYIGGTEYCLERLVMFVL